MYDNNEFEKKDENSFDERSEEMQRASAELMAKQILNMKKEQEKRRRNSKIESFFDLFKSVSGVVLIAVVIIGVAIVLSGFLFQYGWNYAVVNMFDVNKLALFDSIILCFTIANLKESYNWEKKIVESKKANGILHIVFFLFSIFIFTPLLFKYSWNVIVPGLLKLDIKSLTYWQSFWFVVVVKTFTGRVIPKKEKEKNN